MIKVAGDHLQFIELGNPVVCSRAGVRPRIFGRVDLSDAFKICLNPFEEWAVSIMELQTKIEREALAAGLQAVSKRGFSVAESGYVPGVEWLFREGICFSYNRIPVQQFVRHSVIIAR